MEWVIRSSQEAARKNNIQVGLIASVNRHESLDLAEQVAWLAADHIQDGLVGLDLAGNEAEFSALPFQGLFKEARESGLRITIHAGEWAGAANVREAIEGLGAERIGHGVRVLEDDNVTALAAERKTTFEVCVTSNYQSGVVADLGHHPLASMLNQGLNATVNTDDPSVSRITLSHEYQVACEDLGIPLDVLKQTVLAAAEASFLPEDERIKLVASLQKELHLTA
jgi:adenosine deaminase